MLTQTKDRLMMLVEITKTDKLSKINQVFLVGVCFVIYTSTYLHIYKRQMVSVIIFLDFVF